MPPPINLMEGSHYELMSVTAPTKTVVHVKLTDAALKAVEAFSKSKNDKRQISIQFQGNQGAIKIPVPAAAGAASSMREFGFALSSVDANDDCLQQSRSALEEIGSMSHKITVQGSDDSYENTRVKMAQAEEENRKGGAKVIKQSGPNIHKVVKTRIPAGSVRHNTLSAMNTVNRPPSPNRLAIVRPQRNTPTNDYKPPPRPPVVIPGAESQAAKRRRTVSPSPMPPKAKHHQDIGKVIPSSEVRNLSLRDRVIHHLALRQYTRPELLLRLHRDGLDDNEKDQIVPILGEVALLTGVKYTLLRQIYGDININCPLYSDDDRLLLSQKLLQVNTAGSSTSPAVSPCHSAGKVSPGGLGASEDSRSSTYSTSHAGMKTRIAHMKKDNATPSIDSAAHGTFASLPGRAAETPHGRNARVLDVAPLKLDKRASLGLNSSTDSDMLDEDYMSSYVKITSDEQRRRYRADFDKEYAEYKAMYSRVSDRMKRFNELSRKIREHQKGTVPYERLCQEIIAEYKVLKANELYCEERKQCQYLHGKLEHVKSLVSDYDFSDASFE